MHVRSWRATPILWLENLVMYKEFAYKLLHAYDVKYKLTDIYLKVCLPSACIRKMQNNSAVVVNVCGAALIGTGKGVLNAPRSGLA